MMTNHMLNSIVLSGLYTFILFLVESTFHKIGCCEEKRKPFWYIELFLALVIFQLNE